MENLRKLRFQMYPQDIEWKEVDQLLAEKSAAPSIVHDFTVHHQNRSPLVITKTNKTGPRVEARSGETILDPERIQPEEEEDSVTSPFQLTHLDDSPRSSQFHIKDMQDNDGQESQFYELCVLKNTPPDILEPTTKQAYFTTQHMSVNPCPTTIVGRNLSEQCAIATSDHGVLVSDRTNSYSTFRPPVNEEEKMETTNFLLKNSDKSSVCHSKSPSPSSTKKYGGVKPNIPLRNPDIGDEPIAPANPTLKKKEVLGLHVTTPVVPTLEKDNISDQRKDWCITTV